MSDIAQEIRALDAAVAGLPDNVRDSVIQAQIDAAQGIFRRECLRMGLEQIDTMEKAEAFIAYFEAHPELDPRIPESHFKALAALDSNGTFREIDEEAARSAAAEAEEKRRAETPSRADINRQRLGVIKIEGNRTIVRRENTKVDDAVFQDLKYQRLAREAHGVPPQELTPEYLRRLKELCIRSRREKIDERGLADLDRGNRLFGG